MYGLKIGVIVLCIYSQLYPFAKQGIVVVPVADVLGECYRSAKNCETYYKSIPICGQKLVDCPRIHQFLMNERVTILEENNSQYLIKASSFFYEVDKKPEKFDTFWILKKNVITEDELAQLHIPLNKFPSPIYYHTHFNKDSTEKTVVLQQPWYEKNTKQILSVGTRFVIKNSTESCYNVYFFNRAKKSMHVIAIAKKVAKSEQIDEPFSKKIERCLMLIRSWIHNKKIIPYVWGGCSLTCYFDETPIERKESNGESYYERASTRNVSPKIGFDCTGLLLRSAQICGLPFYFKNSFTILKNIDLVQEQEKIKNGDLLWIPGHIMIVSDVEKNYIIEARGYNHGYGKVQELPLEKVFKDIKTYKELKDHFHAKRPLHRLDSQGNSAHTIAYCKILSLESIAKLKF